MTTKLYYSTDTCKSLSLSEAGAIAAARNNTICQKDKKMKYLKALRSFAHLDQKSLAKATRVSQAAISRLEQDTLSPSIYFRNRIKKALNCYKPIVDETEEILPLMETLVTDYLTSRRGQNASGFCEAVQAVLAEHPELIYRFIHMPVPTRYQYIGDCLIKLFGAHDSHRKCIVCKNTQFDAYEACASEMEVL